MDRTLAAGAAAGAGILVGTGMVATRFVIDQTDPVSLALLRYVIGVLCLAPPLLMAARVRIPGKDVVPIALLGVGQFGVLIILLNFGLKTVGSGLAALLFATLPLQTMLFAALLRVETLSLAKSLGVILSIVGVGLALSGKLGLPGSTEGDWGGEIAVLGSALCGAVCSVFYRPYLRRYPALHVGAYAMVASVLFLAAAAAFEGFFTAWPRFTTGGWLAVAFIGVSSGVGYYLWLWALQHASPTRVTIFLALSPLVATALGGAYLGEAISGAFVMGLGCVVGGMWLAHRVDPPPADQTGNGSGSGVGT